MYKIIKNVLQFFLSMFGDEKQKKIKNWIFITIVPLSLYTIFHFFLKENWHCKQLNNSIDQMFEYQDKLFEVYEKFGRDNWIGPHFRLPRLC